MDKYGVGCGVTVILCVLLIGYLFVGLMNVGLESTMGLFYLFLIVIFTVISFGFVYFGVLAPKNKVGAVPLDDFSVSSMKQKVGCLGVAGAFIFLPNAVVRFQKSGKEIVADAEEVLVWGNLSKFQASASVAPEQPEEIEDSKLGDVFCPC